MPEAPQRSGERKFSRLFPKWWTPVAHFLLCTTLALCLVFVVDRSGFNPGERDGYFNILHDTSLRAGDITTLVSVALVAIRLAGKSIADVGEWRCARILLHHNGLNVCQLGTMISYQAPQCGPPSLLPQ